MKQKILIVEDDYTIQAQLKNLLSGNGYEVDAVTDFSKVMEQFKAAGPFSRGCCRCRTADGMLAWRDGMELLSKREFYKKYATKKDKSNIKSAAIFAYICAGHNQPQRFAESIRLGQCP